MKIKMLVSMAGTDFALDVGQETERFSQNEATRLISAGYAVPVSAPVIERATAAPVKEKRHPLDHDGDGRKGGSLPRKKG